MGKYFEFCVYLLICVYVCIYVPFFSMLCSVNICLCVKLYYEKNKVYLYVDPLFSLFFCCFYYLECVFINIAALRRGAKRRDILTILKHSLFVSTPWTWVCNHTCGLVVVMICRMRLCLFRNMINHIACIRTRRQCGDQRLIPH